MVDLRGLRCEFHAPSKKERCFSEDSQGRTLCPDFVNSAYLRDPPANGQYGVGGDIAEQCSPRFAKQLYCTAHCQPGNDRVQWWTHDYNYCYSKDGAWACPSMKVDALVPKASFTVKPWSEPTASPLACRAAAAAGAPLSKIDNLSVGLLTHEPVAFSKSMATYEELGFFSVLKEFLVFINGRNPATEAVMKPYLKKYPGLFRILGNETNLGIAAGMIELTSAAKFDNFLFMERDFWLVEPAHCVYEQLTAGIALLDTRKVHVVRYRHRIKAGRPNWAENFFLGHEDDAFVGRQPNLACNIFYWIKNVTERWPDQFSECGRNPEMICSDAYYCNWTNNPQMWRLDWWQKEYVDRFPLFFRNDPYYDLGAFCPQLFACLLFKTQTLINAHPSPHPPLFLRRRKLHELGGRKGWDRLMEQQGLECRTRRWAVYARGPHQGELKLLARPLFFFSQLAPHRSSSLDISTPPTNQKRTCSGK